MDMLKMNIEELKAFVKSHSGEIHVIFDSPDIRNDKGGEKKHDG